MVHRPYEDESSIVPSMRRRLARGSSIYGIANFALRALGFILFAIYSRYLPPKDYGVVSIVESVGVVVGILGGLALETGSRRLYFHFAGDAENLDSYIGTVKYLAIAAAGVALIVSFVLGPFATSLIAPSWRVHFFPYLALPIFTAIASQLLQCCLVIYQCQERAFAYSGFVALQSLSSSILTFCLVVWMRHGIMGLLIARALGAFATLVVAIWFSKTRIHSRPRWTYAQETLRISVPLIPHALMAVALVVADRFILQHYRPLSEVGLYALAYNIGMIMTLFTASLTRAWTPLFYSMLRQGEGDRKSIAEILTDIVIILSLVAVAGVLLAPLCIRWFFATPYWPVAKLVPVVLGAYLCHSLFALLQLSVIQARRTPLVSIVSGVALALNIVLNLVWVPTYGMTGAAYATLAAYIVELLLIAVVAHRLLPLPRGGVRSTMALFIFVDVLIWAGIQPQIPQLSAAFILLIFVCSLLGGIWCFQRGRQRIKQICV